MTPSERQRPRCFYLLRRLGTKFCKKVWERNVLAEPLEVPPGCPNECEDYKAAYPTIWDAQDPDDVAPQKKGT